MKLSKKQEKACLALATSTPSKTGSNAVAKPSVCPASSWSVVLPLCPTSNNLFINARRGRVKSPEYRAWIELATPFVEPMPVVPWSPVSITITIRGTKKFPSNSDVANREKATTDLLVSLKKLPGDSRKYVKRNTQEHEDGDPAVPADMLVRITPYKSN